MKGNAPVTVGVPLTSPPGNIDIPPGSAPLVIAKVAVPTPPVCVIAAGVYSTSFVPGANAVALSVMIGQSTVSVYACDPVQPS